MCYKYKSKKNLLKEVVKKKKIKKLYLENSQE